MARHGQQWYLMEIQGMRVLTIAVEGNGPARSDAAPDGSHWNRGGGRAETLKEGIC